MNGTILNLLLVVLIGVLAHIARYLVEKFKSEMNEEKRAKYEFIFEVVDVAVKSVEQMCSNGFKIHGKEKLEEAIHIAETILAKYGVEVDEGVLKDTIEASVYELNHLINNEAYVEKSELADSIKALENV